MRCLAIILVLGSAAFATAQNSLPVRKVTIFKNNTALVVKEGSLSTKNGVVAMPVPDKVLFGSYFIGATKDNAVKNIVFKNDTLRRSARSLAIWQFLAGNVNKSVTIAYSPEEGIDKTMSGKVLSYDLYTGMLKFLTDAGKTSILHVGKIYQADFKDEPAATYMADSLLRLMVLKPEKPTADMALQEVYMTSGINWMPSYFLKLKDAKTARLEMKAMVENFAENLNETDVELVVGAPQMKYSAKLDPMTYDYLTTILGTAEAQSQNYMQRNTLMSSSFSGYDAEATVYFDQNFSIEGEKTGDMYIYKLGKVTLPKESKGSFPIFANTVDYRDKYEGTIYDIVNFYVNRYVQSDERLFDIYHSLEIKNTSGVPLTTASIMVINEKDQFLAQDELKYTPINATSDIRLSKALDIVMKNNEEEQSRTDNAKRIGKTTYSKVVLKGEVTIENFQKNEVTVVVKKNVNGTVSSSSDSGVVSRNKNYSYINSASEIKWEVKLAAGQKKVLSYNYEVFFTP